MSAGPPLTDEQVAQVLNALTRPMYMWRMARAQPDRPGTDKTARRAIQEAREILQDPVQGPRRAQEADLARLRGLRRGQVWFAPRYGHRITVRRVAKDRSWADILVSDGGGNEWTKRQPLQPDGWFPFGVQRRDDDA